MKQRRTAARLRCVSLRKIPLSMLALAAFFLLGALLGGMVAARGAAAMGGELSRYLEGYLALRIEGAPSSAAVWQTMVCFFPCERGGVPAGLCLRRRGAHSGGVCRSGLPVRLFASLLRLGSGAGWIFPAACSLRAAADACAALYAAARQRRVGDLARSCGPIGRRRKAGEGRDLRKAVLVPLWERGVCLFFGAALELWFIPRILSLLLR